METEINPKKKKNRVDSNKNGLANMKHSFRLTSEENTKFEALLVKSGLNDKTKYIKSVLFGREIKVVKIDKATMDYYIRLTNFYTQFQAIGNNYNQTVRALKANFGEKRALQLLYKLEKETIRLVVLSKEIIRLTEEFEGKIQ